MALVLALTFIAALAVAAAVFFAAWHLLGAQGLRAEHRIASQTLFDLVKLSFGVVAGAGALVALVVAYRRQRVDEAGALREEAGEAREATRLHTERFTTAVGQLGEESAAVRLGGVHALAGLADDAPTRALRQTCIDVLCAYLRLPYIPEGDLPRDDVEARHTFRALREVRHTVVRLIRDHLRLPLTEPHSWQGHDFDLTAVVFDGGDFTGAVFSGGEADFTDAVFSGGWVDFRGAVFSGGQVDFTHAVFSGGVVDFGRAAFSGTLVDFMGAKFTDSVVIFHSAEFSGGWVDFGYVVFSGGRVDFNHAVFSGGWIDFTGAIFSGGVVGFGRATFSRSRVLFIASRFAGGLADFDAAVFAGGWIDFERAVFSPGVVSFGEAEFSGSTVDLSGAIGRTPPDLTATRMQSMPDGLHLPPEWCPPTT